MKVKKNIAAVMLTAGLLAALGFGGAALADGGSDDNRPAASASPSTDPSPSPSDDSFPSDGPSPSDDSSASAGPSPSSSDDSVSPGPSSSPGDAMAVTKEQAKAIAVRAAGGGRVASIERETEHGRLVWDVDVIVNGVEHDIDVDAATGQVTRHRTDGDRGRDDSSGTHRGRGSDDQGGDDKGGQRGRGSNDKGDDKGGQRGRGGDDD
jgi:hypothetical protein